MSDESVREVRGNGQSSRRIAPRLPTTVAELQLGRKSMRIRSLNDDVDDVHMRLWENSEYRKYFEPLWREDTVEGSFIADEISAAAMIRKFASDNQFLIAKNAKLHAIVRSLGVVCRRLSISRKERQRLVNDEVVGGYGDDNNDGYGNNG